MEMRPIQRMVFSMKGYGLRFGFWKEGVVCTVFEWSNDRFNKVMYQSAQSVPCETASVALAAALADSKHRSEWQMNASLYELCNLVETERGRRESVGGDWPEWPKQ